MKDYTTELVIGFMGVLFTVILLSLMASDHRNTKLVADLVRGGVDPIAARCAVYGEGSRSSECVIMALKAKEPAGP